MLTVVDDKTLQKVAETFGGEEAVQIVSVPKEPEKQQMMRLPPKPRYG